MIPKSLRWIQLSSATAVFYFGAEGFGGSLESEALPGCVIVDRDDAVEAVAGVGVRLGPARKIAT